MTQADKFRAVAVHTTIVFGEGRELEFTEWYAPGVGVVKKQSHVGMTPKTMVLKSITPGK